MAFEAARRMRFGAFELDLIRGELHKHGLKVKLPEQPLRVLALLLERPGQTVTREELRERLWPVSANTFVDFENGLNAAVGKLRQALGDSAEHPHFIETVPRHGYRFVAPVEETKPVELPQVLIPAAPPAQVRWRSPLWLLAAALTGVVLFLLFGLSIRGIPAHFRSPTADTLIRSLAVLPLENLSGDRAQDFFAESMTEALITDLGKIDSLRVISRTSAMRYHNSRKSLKEIARELGVDAIVEGAVLRSRERVRVTAQLIRADTDQHLWADSYEGAFEDVLALQSQVAETIASQIRLRLTPAQRNQLMKTRQLKPVPYEAYLKGRSRFEEWSEAGTKAAIDYFQQAIKADPQFARAYAGLAECYVLWAPVPDEEAKRNAKMFAARALELDDNLSEAHAAVAFIRFIYDWDWSGADTEFKQAIRLDPGYGEAHHQYSHYLMQMGRIADSYAESKRNLDTDPLSAAPNLHLGWHYLYARQYDDAIRQLQKTLQIQPNYVEAHEQLGQAYEKQLRFKEALAEFQQAQALSTSSLYLAGLGHVYGVLGRRSLAEAILAKLTKGLQNGTNGAFELAVVYAGLRDNDQAFEWLEKDYSSPNYLLAYALRVNPFFDSLHADPRFNRLLQRMNLPPQ